jgi:SNF2-related domain/Helicase conserved C-terminal domain
MHAEFRCEPTNGGARLTLVEKRLTGRRIVATSYWGTAPDELRPAIHYLRQLAECDGATFGDNAAEVTTGKLAELSVALAVALGLPGVTPLSLTLGFRGRVDSPEGFVRTTWHDLNARRVSPVVSGVFVKVGGETGRLSEPLYALLSAVESYNGTSGQPLEARIGHWLQVQEALGRATGGQVSTDGYLGSLTIYQAGAFALDVRETRNGPDFLPVLMGNRQWTGPDDGTDAPEISEGGDTAVVPAGERTEPGPLLPPELQHVFASSRFAHPGEVNEAYVLARNTFVRMAPELKTALEIVKSLRAGTAAQRNEFLRNPRTLLIQAMGEAAGALFVETKQYSDRINGLGIWEKPRIPWLDNRPTQWLPESFQFRIGDKTYEMTPQKVDALDEALTKARADNRSSLVFESDEHPVAAVEEALGKLPSRENTDPDYPESDQEPEDAPDRDILLIKTNIDGVEYELARRARRTAMANEMPATSIRATTPAPHQADGFRWLVSAWRAGWPGVLLADDMGLGKTFQTLAFLAWIKAGQREGGRQAGPRQGPILIVAPTALLKNWIAESELRLVPGALGNRVEAFGSGLQRLKTRQGGGWTPEDALDVDALRGAGWILTTYETLAAYHRAFARVGCAVAVFDEIQKAKSPDTINTHAVKAMNADFVIGLSGTPIENRLEDLWCILDRVAPGYLGDLKSFSSAYSDQDAEALKALKAKLDQPQGATPPVMLRRMKDDILHGLPQRIVKSYRVGMPEPQAAAYHEAVLAARSGTRSPKSMLETIHTLRGISLHPFGHATADPYDPDWRSNWIASSARLSETFRLLREIDMAGEKALVFIEDLAIQKAFAVAVGVVLRLDREPTIINGGVDGAKRQAIVDRFQAAGPGFDLLVLSPRAAGLGLNITAANHVVHLSRWWNPAIEDQCNDRVYRMGQKKPVTVHIPLAVHPGYGESSFDIKLDKLLDRKRALSREMLAPPTAAGDVNSLFEATVE